MTRARNHSAHVDRMLRRVLVAIGVYRVCSRFTRGTDRYSSRSNDVRIFLSTAVSFMT